MNQAHDNRINAILGDRIQARSLVEVVTERLEAAIISGELTPGSRLSEQGVATAFGVSHGPLRESIRRFVGRHLLQRTANIGVHVAKLSWRDLTDLMSVREALEGMACRLAAEATTADELAISQACSTYMVRSRASRRNGLLSAVARIRFPFQTCFGSTAIGRAPSEGGHGTPMMSIF